MSEDILTQLVALSNRLGQPELEYAILGEGNTSARADAELSLTVEDVEKVFNDEFKDLVI